MKKVFLAALAVVSFSGQALAEGDAAAGEKVFKKCMVCHTVDGTNKLGPYLNGVVGRQIGVVEGFKFSPAMTKAGEEGGVWDEATLAEYLANPRQAMPGNRMAFVGLRKEQEQADIIAYLKANP